MKENENLKHPQNETKEHFMLKEIAKYILWGWGYNKLGTEISSMHSYDFDYFRIQNNGKAKSVKNIIDVAGAKKISNGKCGKDRKEYYAIKGIEAKASLNDFKNGFCAAPAHTYIIAPINVIPLKEIPDKIGFIEVDLKNFEIQRYKCSIPDMKGVTLVKQAKKRIDKRFDNKDVYQKWCADTLERIAYRCSSELLFWRNIIDLKTE